MKLPHLFTNDHSAHFLILLLTVVNSLLIITIFFILIPKTRNFFPKIVPVSAQTPVVDFNLIAPSAGATVSGTVPLVTTLSNGPKITSATLLIDNQKAQVVTSKKTQRLTLFWDSTRVTDGNHSVVIQVGQDNNHFSTLTTSLNVQNNVSRNVNKK